VRLVRLRREHPVFRQKAFFLGRSMTDNGVKDLAWFGADGAELDDGDWFDPSVPTLGMYLDGQSIRTRGARGERIEDDSFLLVLRTGAEAATMVLPKAPWATSYDVLLDTTQETGASQAHHKAGKRLPLEPRSVLLLRVTR
jgi:glycogen operon protein